MVGIGRSTVLAIGCAVLASAVVAERAGALEVEGSCSVRFSASSTLHDFEGEAPCSRLAVEPSDASGLHVARAEVRVSQIATGIAARDEKMREMFEAEAHPLITAVFDRVDPSALRARRAGALAFRLALHGVERVVTPELSDWSEVPGESARFRALFRVSLRDFGLEPPVALGFMRVDDEVRVVVDVQLAMRGAAPAAAPHAAGR